MKLLRNKKEVQVKQMKREIAQLLESGQDQTARIRVIIYIIYAVRAGHVETNDF